MTCTEMRSLLSAARDGSLDRPRGVQLATHLRTCAPCAQHERSWRESLDLLADLPRLEAGDGGIAERVFDRLDLENRRPGLALVFRSTWAARPLILPSLVPAALVLVTVVSAALALDRGSRMPPIVVDARDEAARADRLPPSGTEGNPLPPVAEVSAPRGSVTFPRDVLEDMREGTVFVETVVARDGSVSAVTLIGGDALTAAPVVAALRRERFVPGRFRGRPVAVSVYRLISRMDVHAPIT